MESRFQSSLSHILQEFVCGAHLSPADSQDYAFNEASAALIERVAEVLQSVVDAGNGTGHLSREKAEDTLRALAAEAAPLLDTFTCAPPVIDPDLAELRAYLAAV